MNYNLTNDASIECENFETLERFFNQSLEQDESSRTLMDNAKEATDCANAIYNAFRRKKCRFYETIARSFSYHLNKYLNTPRDDKRTLGRRWQTVLKTFMNVEAIIADKDRILEYFQNATKNTNYHLVFACGLKQADENDSEINEEIKQIHLLSMGSNYVVLPVFGCTTTLFRNIIHDYRFKIVHLAGHGTVNSLSFSDADMKPGGFQRSFVNQQRKTVLTNMNCCYTKEYSDAFTDKSFSKRFITHRGRLPCYDARKFSKEFYDRLFVIKERMDVAFKHSKTSPNYSYE